MLTYVLDASAATRFVDEEAGSDRVKELIWLAKQNQCKLIISAVNWGEVVYILAGRSTPAIGKTAIEFLRRNLEVVDASSDRAAHAGLLKVRFEVAYADAFGLELASNSPDHILVTADYGVKPAEADIRIEFLPLKPKQ